MAQGDVNVNVRVDDKGTLKRLDKDAARAARSTNRLGEATAETNRRRNRFNRLEKGTAGITSNSTKAFAKQAQTLGGTLVPAYAALAANIFAITALFNALSSAARVKQLEEGLLSMGTASGIALGTVSAELKIATDNAISLEEAMRAVALASSAGFDSSTIERLGTVAKATSIALGRDTTDALNRLTKGAIKLEPELLDELGIMVRLDDAVEKYASQLGKSADSLTLTERRQAFMNAVLEEGETKFAAVAASVDPNVYDQLGAAVSELGKDFTSFINLIAGPFVTFITQSKILMTSLILLFGGPVLKQVINSLTGVTSGAQKAAQVAKNIQQENLKSLQATGRTTAAFEGLVNAIDKGTVSTQDYQSAIRGLNSDIGKARKAVERGGKGVVAKRKELKKLEDTLKATKEAYSQNSVAVIANTEASAFSAIAQGKFITGIKGLINLIKLETAELRANTVAASANATAILYLGYASRIAGIAVRGLVGILAVLTGGFALVAAAAGIFLSFGEKILNFFRTDEQKKYAEETKTLKTATDELSNSFKELDKGFEDSTITTLTGKYSALSNSLKDLDIRFKQLQETGIDKGYKDPRLKTFRKLFEEYHSFQDQVKLLSPELQRLAQGLNTSNATGEDASKVMSALRTVAGGVAEAFVSVAEALKAANDPLQSFINKSKAKTPLDDLAAAFGGITKELDILQQRASNLSTADLTEQLNTLVKESASPTLQSLIIPEGPLNVPVRIETSIGERDLTKVKEQRDQLAATFEQLSKQGRQDLAATLIPTIVEFDKYILALENMSEAERKAFEVAPEQANAVIERVKNINTLIQTAKKDLLVQKEIAIGLKSQIDLENRRIQSADRAEKILNAEETLRNTQITQLERQATLLENIAASAEEDSATQQALQAEAKTLQAQANALRDQSLSTEEKTLRITKERVALETKMTDIRKQGLDLQLKSAQAAQQILNSQIKIAEIEQKINSLKDPTQRGEVRIGDEIALFEKFRKQREDAAENEFQLKMQQLEIEEQLLNLRLEVIRAELNAALSRETPGSDTAKRISGAIETIDTISGNTRSTIQAQMDALGVGLAETLAKIELEGEELAQKLRDAFVNATGDMFSRMVGLMQNFGDNVEDRKKNFEEFWDTLGNQEKIQGIIGMVQPMIDQFAELGPEGEVIHKMLMAADMIANAWGLAFDRISSHLQKVFGEIAPTSFEEFKVAWGAMGLEDKAAIVGAVATAAAQTMGALADALAAKSQQRVQSIDAEIAAEQKRDGKSAASLAKIAALEKRKEREKRKAFETDKKLRLAQAVMSTAAGIANALTLPPPFNFVMAALVGAMGAAQIATISSMSYQGGNSSVNTGGPGSISAGERSNTVDLARSTAPAGEIAYMRGEQGQGTGASNFVPGGFAGKQYRAFGGNTGFMVGEQGPEMFIPNRPGTVVPADDTARMGGGGGGMNITFNVSAIDSQGVEDFINGSRGQIIESIREAANSQGQFFLEEVDTFDIKSQKFDYSVGGDKR